MFAGKEKPKSTLTVKNFFVFIRQKYIFLDITQWLLSLWKQLNCHIVFAVKILWRYFEIVTKRSVLLVIKISSLKFFYNVVSKKLTFLNIITVLFMQTVYFKTLLGVLFWLFIYFTLKTPFSILKRCICGVL